MRIISGKNKGRKITAPSGLPVRPTTDRAKESLFNILNNEIDFSKITVLDLFAGTGNISYEFVSRGCESVTAVDLNRKCTDFIRHTALNLGYTALTVIRSDYRDFIKRTHRQFNLIIADPPYNMTDVSFLPDLIFKNELLAEKGLLIIEHSKNIDLSDHPLFKELRKYGTVNFSFFQLKK